MRALVLLLCSLLTTVAAASDSVPQEPRRPAPVEQFAESLDDMERMTEAELRQLYLQCSRAAVRGRITTGDVQLCSVVYERLLQGPFGGDFRAFLEWRRAAVRRGVAS